MDVIESLKQKSEENPDPTEDSSEEQTNGLEENADLGSGDSETGKEAEKTDPKDDSEIPLPDCEPKSKRRKVDAARVAASVENDSPSSTLQVHSSDDDFE